jgi:hypothetical protein
MLLCFIEEPWAWASCCTGPTKSNIYVIPKILQKATAMGLIVVAGLLLLVSAVRTPVLFCR